ncbi:fungal trichothecene efflux pump [Xylariomycetidae sp. FL2044]|nr:fungal trichothecene efflux pump [Xylariomycetidae sp. FL2044]
MSFSSPTDSEARSAFSKTTVLENRDQHTTVLEHPDQHEPLPIDVNQLPKGYYRSPRFLGTYLAVSINLMSSTGGFAFIAPVITQINLDIGPGQVIWLSLVFTMMLAVGGTLVGQLSDIFGRRWFFIGGTLLGTVAAVICSQAQTVPVLIGGQTLIGLSAATGYSYAYVLGELVPMRYRFAVNSCAFLWALPSAGFGSAVSVAFITYTGVGWRGAYYVLVASHGTSALLYYLFYYPPTFQQKHGADSILQWVKDYDYVGTSLYIVGLLLFILGIFWGGVVYPWRHAAVIAPIVVGFVLLVAVFIYEYMFKPKAPLIPTYIFETRGYLAAVILLGLGASAYYCQAILFPQMASLVYSSGHGPMWVGLVGSLPGIGCNIGEILGSAMAGKIGRVKVQVSITITIGTAFLGSMAVCGPDTPSVAMALALLGTTAIGYTEAIALPLCTICIKDQNKVGTATGIAGSARSAISTIATAVYNTVLTSRITETITNQVPSALASAGLPPSSIQEYMMAVSEGADVSTLLQIPGVTMELLSTGTRAYQFAYADAFRTVSYLSIAFGGAAIIAALMTPNVDDKMTQEVAATLNQEKEEQSSRA